MWSSQVSSRPTSVSRNTAGKPARRLSRPQPSQSRTARLHAEIGQHQQDVGWRAHEIAAGARRCRRKADRTEMAVDEPRDPLVSCCDVAIDRVLDDRTRLGVPSGSRSGWAWASAGGVKKAESLRALRGGRAPRRQSGWLSAIIARPGRGSARGSRGMAERLGHRVRQIEREPGMAKTSSTCAQDALCSRKRPRSRSKRTRIGARDQRVRAPRAVDVRRAGSGALMNRPRVPGRAAYVPAGTGSPAAP